MITKQQIQELKPLPFEPVLSFTRFKNGAIVPQSHPAFTPPRFKKTWDGNKYTVKTERGFYPYPKKKK